ncbi:MAG: hypothetical protein K8963_05410 [Proteobacteria bacterium]|nr:hypothetical protein [Pseudomonadota bacterium]
MYNNSSINARPATRLALVAALACVCATGFSACKQKEISTGKMEKTNLTHGQVQLTLQKGVTTQSKVLETFGAPNIVTTNESGREEWSYQRNATVSEESSSSSSATVLFFGGSESSSQQGTSSRSILLIIEFDENKIVSNFRSRTTNF